MNRAEKVAILALTIGAAAVLIGQKRKYWVKPWIQKKRCRGNLCLVNQEFDDDPCSYQNFLRMDKATFDKLLSMIDTDIQKQNTRLRDAISSKDRLIITLRFLATGESYKSLSYSFRVGHSTISKIIPEVCTVIYNNLKATYLKVPCTTAEWLSISEEFQEKWNLPNIIGALDGKHIVIKAPQAQGSAFYNYKGTNSIVLLALVDANYKFLYVDVGANGRLSDGGVFKRSKLAQLLTENKLKLPEDTPLPGRTKTVPFVIVADAAFPLTEHIIKPFPFRNMNVAQRIYNYRISRVRRVVENAFGILSNRFRVFLSTINLSPEKAEIITLAAVALHNYLRIEMPSDVMPDKKCTFKYGLSRQTKNNRATQLALEMRQEFMEYVNGSGAVSWQNNFI